MHWFFPLATGLLFAVWQSFSDALAWRIYTAYYSVRRKKISDKLSYIVSGRSVCEYCAATIPAWGLIPVAGYFLVRGRCRVCTRRISWRFPLFEAIAFAYGFFIGLRDLSPLAFGAILVVYALLWIVITIDYRMLLIPTEVILGLLLVALANIFLIRYPGWHQLQNPDLGLDLGVAFIWYFLFHLLRIASGYKMGLADVRLVLALGLLLGQPASMYLPGVAAGLAIVFYLLRRYSILVYAPAETQIPFGVFLSLAYLLLDFTARIA
jgi:leader peptidase (prepilin peptidase) / N-methyltransferase